MLFITYTIYAHITLVVLTHDFFQPLPTTELVLSVCLLLNVCPTAFN